MRETPVSDLGVRPGPTSLAVVGAAVGMGRWLVEHVLAAHAWQDVSLVDVADRGDDLADAAAAFDHATTRVSCGTTWRSVGDVGEQPDVPRPGPLVVVAVPPTELPDVAGQLQDVGLREGTVVVVADRLTGPTEVFEAALPTCAVVGLHPLFERSATSLEGQIVYVVPGLDHHTPVVFVSDLLRAAGGVVTTGSAAHHDEVMTYVQVVAHQTLLNFVDVLTGSGLDLEKDLWAARTPLFESLFGLTARVLDPGQRNAVERLQTGPASIDAASMLLSSARSTFESIADPETTARRLDEMSERLSGSLFSTARQVAQVAVGAAQSTRTELSRQLNSQDLVGLRLSRRPEVLHVGHIVAIETTEVVIEDLLIPGSGRGAVIAAGPGLDNGKRVGARGEPRPVRLNLGQVVLVTGAELDRELDERLAFIRRDVRFLVPESVSGAGVLRALVGTPGCRGHRLVSEVVRTGQRAVVVRLEIRADLDLEDTVERLRSVVQSIYAWPDGICRPAVGTTSRILYLGPPGTFSEVAARHCARAARVQDPELVAADSFDDVLAGLSGPAIAVLPISSSSSGLVTRAFDALWLGGHDVTVGGIVDVSVRLDAYVPQGASLERLRGATLYSHPQALAQCRQFIRRFDLHPVTCSSTTEALREASASALPSVALAAAGADLSGLPLKVGEREVDDLSGSITRFLIVGRPSAFEEFSTEFTPTVRTIYLGRGADVGPSSAPAPADGEAAYDEVLSDVDGNFLLITSRTTHPAAGRLRRLGVTPWSPRTPLVRPGS